MPVFTDTTATSPSMTNKSNTRHHFQFHYFHHFQFELYSLLVLTDSIKSPLSSPFHHDRLDFNLWLLLLLLLLLLFMKFEIYLRFVLFFRSHVIKKFIN